MKKVNIGNLRENLPGYIDEVCEGEEIIVSRRNVGVAKLVPIDEVNTNKTQLNNGKGSVVIHSDLTEPIMDDDWEMNK